MFEGSDLDVSQFENGFIIEKKTYLEARQDVPVFEELIVHGYRQSLHYSRKIKKESIDILDVVASTEFAQYPDLNLAESLQRLPGVTITREAGEGRLVSLRGISPEFTLVTLNGMPVLANNDSPMDSRGQKQRDRAFDFNIFSTDLFDQATAMKSYSAEQNPGGVAGTIALKTARPFDHPGFNSSVSFQMGANDYTDDVATKGSALLSHTGEHWGGLFSYSYSQRESQERGANTFRWRNIKIEDALLDELDTSIQSGLINGDYVIPRGNRYSVWNKSQERFGVGAVLQYDSDAHKITLDMLYAELNDKRTEFHLYPRGSQSTPVIPYETKILDVEINKENELIFARYQNARVASESRQQFVATDYKQIVLHTQHDLSPTTILNGLLGIEQSEFNVPYSNKVYMQSMSDINIDYRKDRFFADIDYYNSDLLNPNSWRMSEIDQEYYQAATEFNTFNISIKNQISNRMSWQLGSDHVWFTNSALTLFSDDIFKNEWALFEENDNINDNDTYGQESSSKDNTVPTQFTSQLHAHPKQDWLILNTDKTLEYYGINRNILHNAEQEITSRLEGDLSVYSTSIYIESSLKYDSLSLKGALRYQLNTTKISYNNKYTSKNDWTAILPSLNMTWTIDENWIAKMGLSKNVTKPRLTDLSTAPSYDLDTQTVFDDNSDLLPYSSNNIDLSLESYWSKSDLFSISLFYKNINDYIVTQSTTAIFDETEISQYWQDSPFPSGETITLIKKENTDTAKLYGLETHLQHQFSYFHPPWNRFGINIQTSLMHGNISYHDDTTGEKLFEKPMPFLSKKSTGITLYYGSSTLSCRMSFNYRDSYIYRVNSSVLSDEDETGFHSTLYLDIQFAYQLKPKWEFKIEVFNLSNEREEQYSDSSNRPYNTTTSGRSIYTGISFKY